MTNNIQQTAVDSIIEFMKNNQYFIGNDLYEFMKQAKEMEKKQIIEAFDFGDYCVDLPEGGWKQKYDSPEQYYNETYGDPEQAIIDYNKMEEESEMDDYNNLGND
jgi:hypothetical protein